MKIRFVVMFLCLAVAAYGESAAPRVNVSDVKNHIGEMGTVCGKVVDAKVAKYGISGRGKPVSFYLEQPESNPVFYFVAFGTQEGGAQEAISAYQGKQVCVSGKITQAATGPFIMAADRAQIKAQPEQK